MAFVPLHIYSPYSFLKSGFTMERLFSSLKRKHYSFAGISDLGVMEVKFILVIFKDAPI